MNHDCPTGHHTEPHYHCYGTHGCRCDGCREAKVARNRHDRHNGNPPDATPWTTPEKLAEKVNDLTAHVDALEQRLAGVEAQRDLLVKRIQAAEERTCDHDCGPVLPDRYPAGPLVELVERRHVDLAQQLPSENLRATYYRARRTGWLTVSAADRLSIALGHTLETLWPDYDQEAA